MHRLLISVIAAIAATTLAVMISFVDSPALLFCAFLVISVLLIALPRAATAVRSEDDRDDGVRFGGVAGSTS